MHHVRRLFQTTLVIAICLLGIPITAVGTGIQTGDGSWTWANAVPVGASLEDVSMASTTKGWAVGYAGTILTTNDGGASWSGQISGTYAPMHGIDSVSTSDAWAVGRGGLILHTIDGGSNWTTQTVENEASPDLNAVDFINASSGWACGAGGTIMKTNTGGGVWTAQTSGSTAWLSDIAFSDANNGMAVAGGGTLLQTSNGGTTWTEFTGTKPWGSGNLNSVQALSSSTWIIGGLATYISTDSGATWATTPGYAGYDVEAQFLDANTGWVLGRSSSSPFVRYTTDGGSSWTYVDLTSFGLVDAMKALSFSDANNGVIVGRNGALARTADGGATWVPLSEYPVERTGTETTDITCIDFMDSSNGIAAGYNKRYWLTDNGGQSWSAYEFPAGGGTDAVEFPTASVGYALSQNSGQTLAVMKSTNGGADFSTLAHPLDDTYYARDLVAPTTQVVWAVGAYEDASNDQWAWVMRSSDGGSTFATQTIDISGPVSGEMSTIFALDANTAWIAGEVEDIYYTTDGGATWTAQTNPSGITINDMHFVDANNGWAVGRSWSGTGILQTTDAGANWSAVDLSGLEPSDLNLTSVLFSDSQNGVAVGYHNPHSSIPVSALVTEDGGTTWNVENTGCDSQSHQLAWDGTRFWFGGDNNRLLYRGDPIPDTLAPVTTASGVPTGWTSEDVTVTLTAVDHGSGVASTAYSLDGGASASYSAPFAVTAEGYTTIGYASTDASSNVEATKTVTAQIDKTPPSTGVAVTGNGTESVKVDLNGSDGLSGVDETWYKVGDGSWTAGTSVTLTTPGDHTVYYYSTDNATPANTEVAKSVDVTVADPTPVEPTITRIAGSDRYTTAVEASKANFASAATVVLATGANFADALAASGLAGSYDAPLLLTRTGSLPSVTQGEIERLGATEVILVGGTGAISDGVESAVDALSGVSVRRIAGATRYHTAAEIAEEIATHEGGSFANRAFIARGDSFADALAAAPLAYSQAQPILLVRPTSLPSITGSTLEDLGITDCTIAGGTGAVSDAVLAQIDALSGMNTPYRAAGANRYATAKEIADYGVSQGWATYAFVGVATGASFPDGLSGGACAGSNGGVLLLTRSTTLSSPVSDAIGANTATIEDIEVYGGTGAVSAGVYTQIESLLD